MKRELLYEFDTETKVEFIWEKQETGIWQWIYTRLLSTGLWVTNKVSLQQYPASMARDPIKVFGGSSKFRKITEEELFSILL